MGTRGCRIIRFRGRYWIFCNHWDSYPDGLGKWLVNSIPTDPEQYQNWLQSQRDHFTKWDSLLQQLLTIQPEDMRKLRSGEPHTAVFFAAFDGRLSQNAPPYYPSALLSINGWIEWTYTIDLDREVFSVDNGAHFRLNHIPRNDEWIEALFIDSRNNRYLLPHLVPAESVATLALDPPSFTVSTDYAKLQTRTVKPRNLAHTPPSTCTGPKLRWMLFNIFQKSQQADLSLSLLGWQAQDLPFRELAFFILCLATGGENLALMDQRCVKRPYSEALYLGLMKEDSSELDIELATCLGVGYHMAGLPMGSAPEGTKYWFEGALISLVRQLDYPGILEAAIADAVEYGRANCTAVSFNAVLISIEHLVLIKSLPDGTVDHTELLPLVLITSHISKDPRARYSDQALDTFYAALEEHDEDSIGDVKHITPVPVKEVSTRNTFMALVQFFEATTLETLRPTEPNEARLPEEIFAMMLLNVSDIKTYNACLKVSRRFRLICQQRSLIMDNIVLLEPLPKDPDSSDTQEKEKKTRKPHPLPDFLALEVSSDRQMEVWLRPEYSRNDGLECFIVAGKEWNKKTFANLGVKFQGLRVPLPGADETGKHKMGTAEPERAKQTVKYGSEGTKWERAITENKINTESEVDRLGEFWKDMISDSEHPLLDMREPEWTFPPNTVCYFGKQISYGYKGGSDDIKYFRYLYIRVKRESKFWGNQWDDIIHEATEELNDTEDDEKKYRERPEREVLGADEPYVILTVGLEVRLFRWEQGFDESVDEEARRKMSPSSTLRELNPSRVLTICEKSDREEIEKFLEKALQHRAAIKAKLSEKREGKE